jgi:crotonobetainyl-CoA:carnitine CoA-transferase CaiB-like acyl-CoA transferase
MQPLQGIRVVEAAMYALVPAAGAVLSDWGADVMKVEHPETGDPIRHHTAWGIPLGAGGFNYLHETFNRGKRSIGINLATDDGREAFYELLRSADVFITSFLPAARRKLRIEADDVLAVNPRIIYARGSGYGQLGPQAERGGFDAITYWYRTGIGAAITAENATEVVSMPGPAFGDIQGAVALAAGISAALFQRERTGEGVVVDTSLFAAGLWAASPSFVGANMIGADDVPKHSRAEAASPLSNTYRTSDGRFIALSILQSDRYWPEFCAAIARPDLLTDPRFATLADRDANSAACIVELDKAFAAGDLAHWIERLSKQEGQWEVVTKLGELNDDEQAWANGYLQDVDYGDGRQIRLVPAPVQFGLEQPVLRPAPELGAQTEEILLELGMDWDRISELRKSAAI